MRPIRRFGPVGPVLLIFGIGAVAAAKAPLDATMDSLRWLSPETMLFLNIDRPTAVLDRIQDDRVQRFVQAVPGLTQALESEDMQRLRGGVEFAAAVLETSWDQGLRDLADGGIVLALESAEPLRFVVVVTPADPAFLEQAHSKLLELARLDARNKNAPDPITQAEYRGLPTYRLQPNQAGSWG